MDPINQNKLNTFVIPLIRTDLIERCLETLYKHTPHNFYVYVIDQSPDGMRQDLIDKYVHMYIRPYRNLGFAKATNTGIKLVETPYFTMCNDDVEFINKKWWQGVLDTFSKVSEATPERPAVLVNPSSLKLPDWSVGRASGDDFYILPYKTDYTDEEYDHLVNDDHYVNEHLTLRPGSVIDGVTMYCSVAHTRRFLDVGLLDEQYYPGGAEDYDYCCRASMKNYRLVGTTNSWVFHHWSSSLKAIGGNADVPVAKVDDELRFGDHMAKWGPRFDIWGPKCKHVEDGRKCQNRLITQNNELAFCPIHPEETFDIPESIQTPL